MWGYRGCIFVGGGDSGVHCWCPWKISLAELSLSEVPTFSIDQVLLFDCVWCCTVLQPPSQPLMAARAVQGMFCCCLSC